MASALNVPSPLPNVNQTAGNQNQVPTAVQMDTNMMGQQNMPGMRPNMNNPQGSEFCNGEFDIRSEILMKLLRPCLKR